MRNNDVNGSFNDTDTDSWKHDIYNIASLGGWFSLNLRERVCAKQQKKKLQSYSDEETCQRTCREFL